MKEERLIMIMEDEKLIEVTGDVPLNEFIDYILDHFEGRESEMKKYRFSSNFDYISIN
jgi:hypothetical protein